MEIELGECSKCKAMNAPQRTACRCCGARLAASSHEASFGEDRRRKKDYPPTLRDMAEVPMRFLGAKALSLSSPVFGFKGLLYWGLIVWPVIYFQGWFAAVLVLAFLFLLYCLVMFSKVVSTMLTVASGEMAEIRHDLLKMQESIHPPNGRRG